MLTQGREQASILVVDDNPLIQGVVRALLSNEHYRVYTCSDGEEALQILSTKNIELILSDVMMPKMDGYALHDAIRQNPNLAHIPFVFLTALDDKAEIRQGHSIGADEYITKPFEAETLLNMVEGKVRRSRGIKKAVDDRYDSYRKKIVHTLSHEFRTPLVAINTGTELLLEQNEALEHKKVLHLLEAIRRGGERLEQLVNDFMVLQQIDAGVAARIHESRVTKVFVRDLFNDFCGMHEESLKKDGFKINFECRCKEESTNIYSMHILDVLNRIVGNVKKFSTNKKEIECVVYKLSDKIRFEIRDRGIGMDVERVSEAVDTFGQLDREKLEQQGSGLGLAIASRYASINGGTIEFESRKDGGSIVTLVLPLA